MTGKELLDKLQKLPEEVLSLPIFLGYETHSVNDSTGTGWTDDHSEEIYTIGYTLVGSGKKEKKCIILGGEYSFFIRTDINEI